MKNIFKTSIFLFFLFCITTVSAQGPQKMNYQAVIRDAGSALIQNSTVGMQISILQGSVFGPAVYSEALTPVTNVNGLVTVEIGNAPGFDTIDWKAGPYFLLVETDPTGGTNYTISGTSQLLSVPYSMYTETADVALNYNETDPVFGISVAAGITDADTTNWNDKTETDPVFGASIAAGSTGVDTAYWNDKTEVDPVFDTSIAAGITGTDTANWNDKTEIDPVFNASIAAGITGTDTAYWNDKTEVDPVFNASIAAGITGTDTANWNDKSDFDGNFSSLTNAPDIANSTSDKTINLNTNNASSSLSINKANGTSVFKVDGNGKMQGDGSGLSNVKSLINYIGGDQRFQITANYGVYNNVRTVTLTVPANGICFAMASGYADWESPGWDLLLCSILMDQDPNTSWPAENEWYSYLTIVTDYNCPDSSDQYTSFTSSRCFPVTAGTHTFTLWANKYSSSSITEVADVNLSVMFFPTGGTGKGNMEENQLIEAPKNPGSVSGN